MSQELDACPKCKRSLIGKPIPFKDRECFGGATHFKLEIAMYDLKKDRTDRYVCPFCNHEWPR